MVSEKEASEILGSEVYVMKPLVLLMFFFVSKT